MDVKNYTQEQVAQIVAEAQEAAVTAARKFFQERLGGVDQFACGFAWTTIHGVRGNTRVGKALKALGFSPAYTGGLQLWNPAKMGCQNIDTLEAGAEACAEVLRKHGFTAYAGSRLD